jgi:2,4-dienoyl-CoA reductase-like NADH-dependent reductase (Old Yellow Enzyme family)
VNQRTDEYGGSFENRARFLYECIEGVRAQCGKDFSLGVRLSPERFGMDLGEILGLAGALLKDDRIDYLDMSLWDCFKPPVGAAARRQDAGRTVRRLAARPHDGWARPARS